MGQHQKLRFIPFNENPHPSWRDFWSFPEHEDLSATAIPAPPSQNLSPEMSTLLFKYHQFHRFTQVRFPLATKNTSNMSQVLSNLSFSLPSSARITSTESRNFCFLKTNGASYNSLHKKNSSIKVVAADNRANLDHLQRASKHQQQTQPKKKVVPFAPPGLWDRFPTARTVQQMMETMERIMEDPYAYSGRWPSPVPTNESGYGRGRTPWEIKEGESEYKMRFDVPGMTKEDVKVWVEEKMLVVKAEKTPAKKVNGGENGKEAAAAAEEEEEEEWSAKSYGRYSSRIALPENIQFEKIKAEVKDGVLYINIPKASTAGKILDIEVK